MWIHTELHMVTDTNIMHLKRTSSSEEHKYSIYMQGTVGRAQFYHIHGMMEDV